MKAITRSLLTVRMIAIVGGIALFPTFGAQGYKLPSDTATYKRLMSRYFMTYRPRLLVIECDGKTPDTSDVKYEAMYQSDTTKWFATHPPCWVQQDIAKLRVSKPGSAPAILSNVHMALDSATIIRARLTGDGSVGDANLIVLSVPRNEPIENMPTGEITGRITMGADKAPLKGIRVFVEQAQSSGRTNDKGEYHVPCPIAGNKLLMHFWGSEVDSFALPVAKKDGRSVTAVDVNYDDFARAKVEAEIPLHRFLVACQDWSGWADTRLDQELRVFVYHVAKGSEFHNGSGRYGEGKGPLFKLLHIDKRGAWIQRSASIGRAVSHKEIDRSVKFGPEPVSFGTNTADGGTTFTVYVLDNLDSLPPR